MRAAGLALLLAASSVGADGGAPRLPSAPAAQGPLGPMLRRLGEAIPSAAPELARLSLPEAARPCLAFEVLAWLAGAPAQRMSRASVERLGREEPEVRLPLPLPVNGPICDPAGPCDCGRGRGNPMCGAPGSVSLQPTRACWREGFQELRRAFTAKAEAVRVQAYERALARALGQEPPPLRDAQGGDALAVAESPEASLVEAFAVPDGRRRPSRCWAGVDPGRAEALLLRLRALQTKPAACR